MKRITFLFISLLTTMFINAQDVQEEPGTLGEQIDFSMEYVGEAYPGIDDVPVEGDIPRSPVPYPTVYFINNTLIFIEDHPIYNLNIKNSIGVTLYEIVLGTTETQVLLPTIPSDTYKLEIRCGNWLFTGYITL